MGKEIINKIRDVRASERRLRKHHDDADDDEGGDLATGDGGTEPSED